MSDIDVASDSIICENIKASNNCCSEIDEIKIVKNYIQYSQPKMNYFIDQMTLSYGKIFGLN